MFACNWIEKSATRDNYETGCEISRTCVFSEKCNITAGTLAELLKRIGAAYGLELADVWFPGDDCNYIGFNQLETASGYKPLPRQLEEWKAGRVELFLCDYTFSIEYRETRDVTAADFAAESIAVHS